MIIRECDAGQSKGRNPMSHGNNPIACVKKSFVFEVGGVVSKVDNGVEPKPADGEDDGEDDFMLQVVFEVGKAQ